MIQFDIITIFPKIFDSWLAETFIKKARDKKIIKINVHNLRDWSDDERKTVDDRPYGGGLGMVLKVGPIYRAIKKLKKRGSHVVLFTPRGKKFTQKKATELAKHKQIIMICGRYEGVDERVADYIADEKLSIGNYDLMGGELPAMVVIESICRLVPNVLGKPDFLNQRKTESGGFIEYAQYTRPEIFEPKKGIKWRVPKTLLSGNQKEIGKWRDKRRKVIEK
ncbi:MAG: tRNA (guanosine(37)-N1)-methyltransferase TrmD [Candidatus Pacebacteria bacterium]|nr:tRNA (guanosine(37)-N1)-methyltransferase TrmD [Candidatus Paceibacterota bacterium]